MSKNDKTVKTEEIPRVWEQEVLLQTIKRTTDPRFGDITVMKHSKTNEVLFAKEKMTTSKADAQNDLKELKSRQALNGQGLQELKGYSAIVKKELCSTNYITKGFYEFPRTDLQKESGEKKRNLEEFSSSELTHFLYQGLEGLEHLHNCRLTHGDVRPQLLGYNKSVGEVKLLDRLADPSPLEKVQSSNIVNKKELFMSPELYRKLTGKDKTLQYSATKNDLYSLGLSILCLGIGENAQSAYRPNGDFNQERIDEMLVTLDNRVGSENPYLMTVLRSLLANNEIDRPDFDQLKKNMISYNEYKDMENKGIRATPAVSSNAAPPKTNNVIVNKQDFNENKSYVTYTQPAMRASYSNNVQATPVRTSYSNYVQAAPVRTSYSNNVQAEPVRISYSNYVQAEPVRTSYSNYVQAAPLRNSYSANANANAQAQTMTTSDKTTKVIRRSYIDGKLVDEKVTYEAVPSNTTANISSTEYQRSFKEDQLSNSRVYSAAPFTHVAPSYTTSQGVASETAVKVYIIDENGNKIPQDPSKYAHLINGSNSQPAFASAPVTEYFSNDEPSVKAQKMKYVIDGQNVREVPVTEYTEDNFDQDNYDNNMENETYDN